MERCLQELGTIHKQGWLYKSPPVTRFNEAKPWKRRYFVMLQINPEKANIFRSASKNRPVELKDLHSFYLVYWEGDHARKTIGSQSLSAIPLLSHYHAHAYKSYEQKYQNTVLLVTDNRVYFLSAENEAEMNSWCYHLSKVINWDAHSCEGGGVGDEKGSEGGREKKMMKEYCERVELPPPTNLTPVKRESWTIPKRFDSLIIDSEPDVSTLPTPCGKSETSESCPTISTSSSSSSTSSTTPTHKSTLLKRCSFGSVHGYHSNERRVSMVTTDDITVDDVTTYDDTNTNGFHNGRTGYACDDLVDDLSDDVSISMRSDVDVNVNLTKCMLRPFSTFHQAANESIEHVTKFNETPKDTLHSRIDDLHSGINVLDHGSNPYNNRNKCIELYNFSKGPHSSTLYLFDSLVSLPSSTTINATYDGLHIRYEDHEILIRRVKEVCEDIIIEV